MNVPEPVVDETGNFATAQSDTSDPQPVGPNREQLRAAARTHRVRIIDRTTGTQVPLAARKERSRRRNAIAKQSRKANR